MRRSLPAVARAGQGCSAAAKARPPPARSRLRRERGKRESVVTPRPFRDLDKGRPARARNARALKRLHQSPAAIDVASADVVRSRRAGIGRESLTEKERVLLRNGCRDMGEPGW